MDNEFYFELLLEQLEQAFKIDDSDILDKYTGNEAHIEVPSKIIEIENFAFAENLTIETVKIFDGATRIGARAFTWCTNLKDAFIPESVTNIGINAFYKCPNLTIHAPAGSYTEKYAKEYNIPFIITI